MQLQRISHAMHLLLGPVLPRNGSVALSEMSIPSMKIAAFENSYQLTNKMKYWLIVIKTLFCGVKIINQYISDIPKMLP